MKASTSAALWRGLVVILATAAGIQLAIELFSAPRVLTPGVAGQPLFTGGFASERGPTTFVVKSIPPGSPLVAAGVVPGDRVRFDRPLGRWYNYVAGDTVGLTVLHGDAARPLVVTVPAAASLPRLQVANYVAYNLALVLALLLGVVIGFRRSDSRALRALAATALLSALIFPYSAPEAIHLPWLDYLASISALLSTGVLVFFALDYPDDRPTGWRATLKRGYRWFFGLLVVSLVTFNALLYAGRFEPLAQLVFRAAQVVVPTLFFAALVLAWRAARGEARVRLQWILATLGAIVAVFLLNNLNAWLGEPIEPAGLELVSNFAIMLAEIGFFYALFRHRIFDFGLALNRALIYAIVGAILFGAIQAAHAVAAEFLRVDDRNKAVVLTAVLALAVYLSFNQLKARVERVVDRLFFSDWAEREGALRRFVKAAEHASDGAALGALSVAAIDRFTDGAGCALFHRQGDGGHVRAESTLAGAPERLDANDEAVLSLQSERKAVTPGASSAARAAALALPMLHRGELWDRSSSAAGPAPRRTAPIRSSCSSSQRCRSVSTSTP